MPILLTMLSLRSKQDYNTKQNPTLSHFIWDDLKLFNIFKNGHQLKQWYSAWFPVLWRTLSTTAEFDSIHYVSLY